MKMKTADHDMLMPCIFAYDISSIPALLALTCVDIAAQAGIAASFDDRCSSFRGILVSKTCFTRLLVAVIM